MKHISVIHRRAVQTLLLCLLLTAFTSTLLAGTASAQSSTPTPEPVSGTIPGFEGSDIDDQQLEDDDDAGQSTKGFFETGLGNIVVQFARLLAVVLAVFAIFQGAKRFFGGQQQGGGGMQAFATMVAPLMFAGLLMNLAWTASLLSWAASLVGQAFEAIGELISF